MTKKEFREQKEQILAAMANAEGDKMNELREQLQTLTAKFNAETAEINREEVDNRSFSLREALVGCLHNKSNQINMRAALTTTGLAGKAIETEMQSILEPLYAKSVLNALGVKWYKDMPMGDISIPVMGKGSVSWVGETGASGDGTPTFGTNVVLKPKRLTGHFDISEAVLLQDTLGTEEVLRREAVASLVNKLEETILGNAAGTDNQPAGLFYGATIANATDFKKVCELESKVEDANVFDNTKYLLSTKAKADFRSMAKSAKNTQLVMEGGAIDGTLAITTSNVKDGTKGIFAYGDFSNLAVAAWADLIFKVDDSIAYGNGMIRIYVSGYFDAAKLRPAAFVYGDTRAAE